MATLCQQHQKNNSSSSSNSGSNTGGAGGGGGGNTSNVNATPGQGNLTIKKLTNGTTILATAAAAATTNNVANVAANTIFPTDYSGPTKFVLPGGAGSGQPPQIIQLHPHQLQQHLQQQQQQQQQTYQIVSGPVLGHLLPKGTKLATVGGGLGGGSAGMMMATTTSTLNGIATTSNNNHLNNAKIISISNSGGGGVGNVSQGMVTINNSHNHTRVGQLQPQQQQQQQFVNAGGNILRIVPAPNNAGNGATAVTNNSTTGGAHQVFQVMGQDGRIVPLTVIKKQQQQQQQIISVVNGTVFGGGSQGAAGGGGVATTTTAGTIILNKTNAVATTPATNRISASGGGSINSVVQQNQQQKSILLQQNNNNNNNSSVIRNKKSIMNSSSSSNIHNNTALVGNDNNKEMVIVANGGGCGGAVTVASNNNNNNGLKTGQQQQQGVVVDSSATSGCGEGVATPVVGVGAAADSVQVKEEISQSAEGGDGVEAAATATAEKEAGEQQKGPGENEEEGDEPEIDIVINNVVCSFSVGCHLNLREIALNGHNVEYRREIGMVTMKLRKPYTTSSMWSSGKITCTGATSEDQAKAAARRISRCLQKLEFKVRLHNFRIVNVLGTCHMPWDIKITNFSERHRQDASYEPELHPGVTYKLKTPKATLKIFSTGSVTVTAASVAHVQEAIEHIFPLLYEFRKERPKAAEKKTEDPAALEKVGLKDAVGAVSSDDEDGGEEDDDEVDDAAVDSDDNITREGRLKEESFWSDDDGDNGRKLVNGRSAGGLGIKRKFEGKSSTSASTTRPRKIGRFAKSKPFRRRRPLGKASNDPSEDVMVVSDVEDDPDDF